MHIQEGTNTTLTTCTKMTEEVDRRHGVNGTSSSSKSGNEEPPVHNSVPSATGGRLQFFKDGKFILELVRGCAREGERAGWVSVPRKTFWPPAAAPPASPLAPPPSATSLSDDNSSLHSSPCTSHRDHCWKQPTPRRNLSKELAMYYCRPTTLRNHHIHAASRHKRRRPYDTSYNDSLPNGTHRKTPANGICEKKRNGEIGSVGSKLCKDEDTVDGPSEVKPKTDDERWQDFDREKYYHMKLKKPYQYHKLRVYKKTKSPMRRKELTRVIDRLREKIASLPVQLVNAKIANCKQEHTIVSPRKRILREMERVSLEEGTKRRAKTVPALSTASYPPSSPGPSSARAPAGAGAGRREARAAHVSSYSIHSLLSLDERAPPTPDPSPSPPAPYRLPEPAAFRAYAPPPRWPPPAPAHYALYPYPPVFRPAPLWMHYAPWPPLAHPVLTEHIHKDETTSDLPLNLSKH